MIAAPQAPETGRRARFAAAPAPGGCTLFAPARRGPFPGETTMAYVDGFVLPVKRERLAEYLKLARLGRKLWLEHGALDYHECIADDAPVGKLTSFPRSVKLKDDEVVFFSWIVYKSRRHRDAVNKKVMADPRMKMDPKGMPFDMKRMIYGGFKQVVSA